jgi:hypothetical protein
VKNWKIAEIALMAASALIAAAKSVMKFFGYLGKMKRKSKAPAPA